MALVVFSREKEKFSLAKEQRELLDRIEALWVLAMEGLSEAMAGFFMLTMDEVLSPKAGAKESSSGIYSE